MPTPKRLPLGWALSLLAALFGLSLAACGDKLKSNATPILIFEPEPPVFRLPKLRPTDPTVEQAVKIANQGVATLEVGEFKGYFNADFDLYYISDTNGERLDGIIAGKNSFPARVAIEPGQAVNLVLAYHPSTEQTPEGFLTFRSNDAQHDSNRIPIVAATGTSEISVAPSSVDFGAVDVGTRTEDTVVTVTNLGQETLTLESLSLAGSGFHARIGEKDIVGDPALVADPDADGTPGLSPGAAFQVGIGFEAMSRAAATGSLDIASSDAEKPIVHVPLTANGSSACLQLTPRDDLDLGTVQLGRTSEKAFTLESCGNAPVRIDSIELIEGSAPAFTFAEGTVPPLPAHLPAMTAGQAPPSRDIRVVCAPDAAGAIAGDVEVKSNDPFNPSLKVHVACRGLDNHCPSGAVSNAEYNVRVLDLITLDASSSSDEDGAGGLPKFYRFEVREKPLGSTAVAVERVGPDASSPMTGATPDDPTTPRAIVLADVIGDYVVALQVEDELGLIAPSEACPDEVLVYIHATSEDGIHVEMSWETPADVAPDDEDGADVDMHFRHPRGLRWYDAGIPDLAGFAGLDCFYANPNPDWGTAGNVMDDPKLDLDDVDGFGPEDIHLKQPEDTGRLGAPYKVGIDYYDPRGENTRESYGLSYVTVRIYLDGVLAWETPDRVTVRQEGEFVELADIIWTGAQHAVHPL